MNKSCSLLLIIFFASEIAAVSQEQVRTPAQVSPSGGVQPGGPAKKSSCGCKFQSINQIGVLDGEEETNFHIQTINGLRFGNWFTGIGVGVDYYIVRSVPLFFDVRNYWFKKRNSPFVYGDIGINFPWAKNDNSMFDDIDLKEGIYYDVGIGYKLGLRNNHALLLSAGFNFKRLSGKRQWHFCPFVPPCMDALEEFDYKLNRISMKFGWEF